MDKFWSRVGNKVPISSWMEIIKIHKNLAWNFKQKKPSGLKCSKRGTSTITIFRNSGPPKVVPLYLLPPYQSLLEIGTKRYRLHLTPDILICQDVLEYLQPQYLILCESGAAPRLLKNPNEGKLPELASHLKGVTQPIRHHLVGSWLPGNKKLAPFIITHKACLERHGSDTGRQEFHL